MCHKIDNLSISCPAASSACTCLPILPLQKKSKYNFSFSSIEISNLICRGCQSFSSEVSVLKELFKRKISTIGRIKGVQDSFFQKIFLLKISFKKVEETGCSPVWAAAHLFRLPTTQVATICSNTKHTTARNSGVKDAFITNHPIIFMKKGELCGLQSWVYNVEFQCQQQPWLFRWKYLPQSHYHYYHTYRVVFLTGPP